MDKILLWETFKVYVRGVLISQRCVLKGKKELIRKGQDLERLHEMAPTQEIKQRLATEASKLKLAEATQAAREIMYAKQRAFEFRGKPNKKFGKITVRRKERITYASMYDY